MRFSKVVGHKAIREQLLHAIQRDHVPHALLFHGRAGSGAFSLARALGAAMLCTQRTESGDSCGVCHACSMYDKLVHPDVAWIYPVAGSTDTDHEPEMPHLHEWRSYILSEAYPVLSAWSASLDKSGKAFLISKNESRVLLKSLALKSFEGGYKLVFVWLPELMNSTAANRILKILEEPPAQTLFLLISENLEQVLPTILSRAQLVHVVPYTHEEVADYLMSHKGLAETDATGVAALSEGSMHQAHQLIDQDPFILADFALEWFRASRDLTYPQVGTLTSRFVEFNREEQKGVFQQAFKLVRDSLVFRYGSADLLRLPDDRKETIKRLSSKVSLERAEALNHVLNKALVHLERNANDRLTFFDTTLELHRLLV